MDVARYPDKGKCCWKYVLRLCQTAANDAQPELAQHRMGDLARGMLMNVRPYCLRKT
jgi:hypothetical protein